MGQVAKIHVGLDVHKDHIKVGVAEPSRAAGRVVGKFAHEVTKLLKTLEKVGSPQQLHVVYEAGPPGYGLQRALQAKGNECEVWPCPRST